VALGAGLLFGLITMLVQYVGLFMTGFHTGLFAGVVALVTAEQFRWQPTTVWTSVAVLLGSGLLAAVLNLYWQKGESTHISVKKSGLSSCADGESTDISIKKRSLPSCAEFC
jgi:hypothetical protein